MERTFKKGDQTRTVDSNRAAVELAWRGWAEVTQPAQPAPAPAAPAPASDPKLQTAEAALAQAQAAEAKAQEAVDTVKAQEATPPTP